MNDDQITDAMAECLTCNTTTRRNIVDQSISIADVGPVQLLNIPIRPGVVVLRGANDSGKSVSLEAVSRLAGGNAAVTCREKAASGLVEGLGIRISVRKSARTTGELEALSIEGKLSIADLVSPGFKDPAAADRHRIKALLQLTGVQADLALFGLPDDMLRHVSFEATKTDDIVEMAAKIKRDLEAASRREADAAEKADSMAVACKAATDGVDLQVELDSSVLQARLEDAIHEHGALAAQAQAASDAKSRGEQAAINLEKIAKRERVTLDELRARENEAARELAMACDAVADAEAALVDAKKQRMAAEASVELAANARAAGEREEELLAGWRQTVDHAACVECPSVTQLADAENRVSESRKAIEKAAVARAAVAKADEARTHFDSAKAHRKASEQLRETARATDDALSAAVASDAMTVKNGRLITQHPERGEVFYAERSTGTRWKLAIDEAIKRIRQLGAEQTAVIPVPQEAWSELDPANKRAVDEYAAVQGVTIITAEATDGELRAEVFWGAS